MPTDYGWGNIPLPPAWGKPKQVITSGYKPPEMITESWKNTAIPAQIFKPFVAPQRIEESWVNSNPEQIFKPFVAPQPQYEITQNSSMQNNPYFSNEFQNINNNGLNPSNPIDYGSNHFDNSSSTPTNQNAPINNFNFTMDDLLKYMGDTNAPTMDQIQMDPGYQWQKQQGINAIDESAAGRGLLGSGGHSRDLLDYSQGLASQEYGKAVDRFNQNRSFKANQLNNAYGILSGDRNFAAGRYDTGFNQDLATRAADTGDYQYASNLANGIFNNQNQNWNTLLNNAFKNQNTLSDYGNNAVNSGINLTTDQASALAQLGMSDAQIKALASKGSSDANRGMAGDIFQTIMTVLPFLL